LRKLIFISFLLYGVVQQQAWSQSIATEFGKNRVQYHDDYHKWWTYETENFITYWYGKGKNIGQYVVQMAEYDHAEIQNIMEHRINDKIEIIVYLDQSDLKQSNIGTSETFESSHGNTTIIGNKMFVYFDGNHRDLRQQIRKGIANAYLNAMYARNNLQEIVQSSLSLNLPEWYAQGIVEYLSNDWNHLVEDELRDLWARDKPNYKKFNKIARLRPKVAGHSFWYFVDQTYGTGTVSNILYLMRLNRNLDNAFMFVLGQNFEVIKKEWTKFYNRLYDAEVGVFEEGSEIEELDLSNRDHVPVSMLRLSPNGEELAYAYNDIGKIWVKLRHLESGKEKLIFKSGYRNNVQEPDYNYPLITWHPSGEEVTIVYEYRDKIKLLKYNIETEEELEQTLPEDIQRVYSISYKSDLDYIMSASNDGYSDLMIYYSKGRQYEKLTNDFYDDIDAHYVSLEGSPGILFSSNRATTSREILKMDSIMPVNQFNVYFLPFAEKPGDIIKLLDTPNENERYPFFAENGKVAYLSNTSGMTNRYVLNAVKDENYPNSNKSRNIIRHHAVNGSKNYIYTLYRDGAYKTYLEYPQWDTKISPYTLSNAKSVNPSADVEETPQYGVIKLEEEKEELSDDYLFQTKYEDPEELSPLDNDQEETIDLFSRSTSTDKIEETELEQDRIIEFVSARAVAARSKFRLDQFTTQMDNSVLFEGLESYTQDDAEIANAPMGLLFKGVVKDLFEDYTITAGMRVPTSLNGLETFAIFDDNRGLIDKRMAIYRKTETNTIPSFSFPTQKIKSSSILGLYRLKFPLDVYTSLRVTGQLRFDKRFYLHANEFAVNQDVINEKRISIKGEYVFDSTIPKDDNVLWGTRYKAYVEVVNRFDVNLTGDLSFEASRGFTTVVGFDARHYIPLLNHAIIALRGAGATSFGSDKMLYYLGGVENWLLSSFNNNIGVPPGKNFAYQVIAPNLRGFQTNIRNGSTFLLSNTELRIPIFKYFSQRRIRSSFFRNFMIVGFFDAGTAWHGLTPNSDENPINTATVSQPPVLEINVKYFRDPLVYGYGAGLRTQLLGYNIRVDYAWGVESRSVLDPRLYVAFGKDF